nr:MAG TPA: hypothetical protein [Caudoviricetes sp.]
MRCNIIDIVQRVCVIHYFLYAFKRIYYQQLGYYLYFCGMNVVEFCKAFYLKGFNGI